MNRWNELWNVCFPPSLKPGEVEAFDYILHQIPRITEPEIKVAISSLCESGRYQEFKSKPHQLKAEILRNRPPERAKAIKDRDEFKRVFTMIKAEPDPVTRWNIMCDELGDDQNAREITIEIVRLAAALPGGIEPPQLEPISQLCEPVGGCDTSNADKEYRL